ncbi:MAG: biopolymer transporter ExbD [Chitinophagales bacterium]|nr:biopolymer transporter ExbD [Chitinophagaceae bacterium]MBP9884282.1 biopolymer transporter ExbD [Chitinophagales bacterium]
MSKVKMPKSSVSIDMTPMVDMAFLLVTFFILTTKFRPDEPVAVNTPSSTSTATIPEKGVVTITVANDGRIFFDLDNQNSRKSLIEKMGETYGITFTVDQQNAFATGTSIGIPMGSMQNYLNLSPEDRKKVQQPGIPVDSTLNLSNELGVWLINARIAGGNPVILIKGDGQANFPAVNNVIKTLQNRKVLRFGFITADEAMPTDVAQLK